MELIERITDPANTIAVQAEAIAQGTANPPLSGHATRLAHNVTTLQAWVNELESRGACGGSDDER